MSVLSKRYTSYLIILTVGLIAPILLPSYQIQMTELWILILLALTWDMVGGQMGYNSFGNVLFLGVGMYACAVTQVGLFYDVAGYTAAKGGGTEFIFDSTQFLTGLSGGLLVGTIAAGLAAMVVGTLVLGMRGHYFAICTLGIGIAAGEIAAGMEILGAGSGMTTPEPPDALGDTNRLYYYLALATTIVCFLVCRWLYSTRFGLAINAIRDDEDKAEAMGLHTTRYKVMAWSISALFLGFAGGILGNLKKFIDPIDVAFSGATYGVWMVLMAILGGKGTIWGPVIGAIIFQVMKELFWTYLLGWQRVALGVLIVLIVVFFPQGILGWIREKYPERFGRKVDVGLSSDTAGGAS